MTRKSILVLVVWIVSLVGVRVWAQRYDGTPITTAPEVISGENIGVRVTRSGGNGPVRGTLVVRINGRWVDVVSPTGVLPSGK
jgi:hypothetical protein